MLNKKHKYKIYRLNIFLHRESIYFFFKSFLVNISGLKSLHYTHFDCLILISLLHFIWFAPVIKTMYISGNPINDLMLCTIHNLIAFLYFYLFKLIIAGSDWSQISWTRWKRWIRLEWIYNLTILLFLQVYKH